MYKDRQNLGILSILLLLLFGCGGGEVATPQDNAEEVISCEDGSDCGDLDRTYGDGQTLVDIVGACGGDGCFEETLSEEECAGLCEDGACAASSCDDLDCSQQTRDPVCDGDVSQTYVATGACDPEEGCIFEMTPFNCSNGCDDGECIAGICDEYDCGPAPEATCNDNTARRYAEEGTCYDDDGSARCDYGLEFENCSYTLAECQSGECVGGITQTGEAVIVEYMARPRGFFGGAGQWFEVVNTSGSPISLNGWRIESQKGGDEDAQVHILEDAPSFPAGARLLFSAGSDPAGDGSVTPDYRWNSSDVTLPQFEGWFRLVDDSDEIVDLVYLEPGSIARGHSRVFDPDLAVDAEANDDFRNWCPNLVDMLGENGNFGSPGSVPSPCRAEPCTQYECTPPAPYCADDYSRVHVPDVDVECQVSRFNNPWCDYDRVTEDCAAEEICISGDCEALSGDLPEAGELVITELMGDPLGPDAEQEWIELFNTTDRELSLFGLRLEDNETGAAFDSYQFQNPDDRVGPGEYAVLIRNVDPWFNGGIENGIFYAGGHLKDSPPEGMRILLVRPDEVVVTEVHYGTPASGLSQQLSLEIYDDVDAIDPEVLLDPESWCWGTDDYGAGLTPGGSGTPGAANNVCD